MGILSGQAGEGPGDRTGSHRARHTVLSDAIAEQKQRPSSRNSAERAPTAEPAVAWGPHERLGAGAGQAGSEGPALTF